MKLESKDVWTLQQAIRDMAAENAADQAVCSVLRVAAAQLRRIAATREEYEKVARGEFNWEGIATLLAEGRGYDAAELLRIHGFDASTVSRLITDLQRLIDGKGVERGTRGLPRFSADERPAEKSGYEESYRIQQEGRKVSCYRLPTPEGIDKMAEEHGITAEISLPSNRAAVPMRHNPKRERALEKKRRIVRRRKRFLI